MRASLRRRRPFRGGDRGSQSRVHIYTVGWLPRSSGTGPDLRVFSNARAYSDLGFDVEVVVLRRGDRELHTDGLLSTARIRPIEAARSRRSVLGRASYWIGYPTRRALDYYYVAASRVRGEAQRRWRLDPTAIHHFEYLECSVAAIGFAGPSVFSMNDREDEFIAAHRRIREQLTGRGLARHERRELQRVAQAQRAVGRRAELVLCIAAHEAAELHRQGFENAHHLAMSWPVEIRVQRRRDWMEGGVLRLLHLGRVDSLPSYRSLEFILGEVFPRLSDKVRQSLELVVAGELRDSERTKRLSGLAEQFSQIRFIGYCPDLRDLYATCDLQVVGSTEATGLRTRIVESFAFGLPVLSTPAGAAGLSDLRPPENIEIAETGTAFADAIRSVQVDPERLTGLADAGRRTYERTYSRAAVASSLGELLESNGLWRRPAEV